MLKKISLKKVFSFLFIASLFAGIVSSSMASGGPRFNFLQGDREFFTGRNLTKNQTDLVDPVTATAGDVVEGVIYYHNGIVDTTANNVRVAVTMPSDSPATKFVLGAALSADNADTITDTVIDGQVYGPTGLTINSDTLSKLNVIPGTVLWYPNRSQTPVPLLNNQTGAELFTSGGLLLGDINGCWNYSGYVTFQMKLNAITPPPAQLSLVKDVNVGADFTPYGNMWTDTANAVVGDQVNFRITITNNGGSQLDNVKLTDVLPGGLALQTNGQLIYINGSNTAQPLVGDISRGIDLGPLDAGAKFTVVLITKVQGNFPCGPSVLTNTATVVGGSLTASDTAKVTVIVTGPQCQGQPNIEKLKRAHNDTQNVDATSTTANPGDQITYTLTTRNTGTADATGFVVTDGIKDILDYADVVSISDNGRVVDQPSAAVRDDQTQVQYPAANIGVGRSIDRTFVVKVKNPVPTTAASGGAFDFVMFNQYGNKVVINVARPTVAIIGITKGVRNVTKNETVFVSNNTASRGDVLEYEIKIKNTGNKVVNGAVLKDILPAGVTLNTGSFNLKVAGNQISVTGNIIGDGVVLPDMAQNVEVSAYLKVTVNGDVADNTNLVNKAQVAYENQNKEATASTVVIVPVVPPATTTPPVTPAATLPSAGANPFWILTVISGAAYTLWSRISMKKQFSHLSDFVEII